MHFPPLIVIPEKLYQVQALVQLIQKNLGKEYKERERERYRDTYKLRSKERNKVVYLGKT